MVLLGAMVSCSTGPQTTSAPSESGYHGTSAHFRVAAGDSNITKGFNQAPRWSGEAKDFVRFTSEAERYMRGIKDDLILIRAKRTLAIEQVEAVIRAANLGEDPLPVHDLDTELLIGMRKSSNIVDDELGYKTLQPCRSRRPEKPLSGDTFSRRSYEIQMLDHIATVRDYVEDGKLYIQNCSNDEQRVTRLGKEFSSYYETVLNSPR